MPPPVDVAIAMLARRQYGVVALRQLTALGLSARAVRSRGGRGKLHRIHQGVYAVGHPVLGREGYFMAAVLACGGEAVLSHRSAAHQLGIRRTSRKEIEVTVPRGSAHQRPGIRIHVARRVEATTVDRIPCTTLPRTLLDLAEVVPRAHLRKAITRAEQLRIFDLNEMKRVLAHANGRRGAPILQSVIAHFEPVETETRIEEIFLELCRKYGIPHPRVNRWIAGDRADFHWPDQRVIVETDGWETHGTRTAFEKDRERLQDLVAIGWRVIPFTWRQINDDPDRVARILGAVL
jgi:very-short-patch-repair endonuclease/predicted transcriptional regulator of viral defense system